MDIDIESLTVTYCCAIQQYPKAVVNYLFEIDRASEVDLEETLKPFSQWQLSFVKR
ncbi:MAG: hypothetical protein KGZ88_11660 [Methylomicrobium sp.]|nr:hypothetical protein [Methylomicrobium sp.]